MFEKLHIKICIIAAIISTIYSLAFYKSFFIACLTIISTIIVFYILGIIVEFKLKKGVDKIEQQKISNETEQNDVNLESLNDSEKSLV